MAQQTPRGIRNNNPLNIRKGNNWQGERQPQTDKAFEEFQTMELGLRAGFIIIKNYMKQKPPLNTIAQIISRWAPTCENNTREYIKEVSRRSGINADVRLAFTEKNKLCRIVQAMCWVECGCEVSFGRIENAYELVHHNIEFLPPGRL